MSGISRRNFLRRTGVIAAVGLVSPHLWAKMIEQVFIPPTSAGVGTGFQAGLDTQTPGIGITPQVAIPYQLQTPHHALVMDLDPATYQARFDQLTGQGYRAIAFQGVSNGVGADYGNQPATLSGIFVRDGNPNPWYQFGNIDSDRYQAEFNNAGNTGFKPISVSGYLDFGVPKYAATWLASPDAYAGIHGATSDQYQAFVDAQISAGLRPEVTDGYPVGAVPGASAVYISLWDNANTLPWYARHGLTSSEYQSEFDTWGAQGFRVYSLSAYQINGTAYFAALWVQDGLPDWFGRHNWLPADLFNQAVSDSQNDYQPIVIEPYDSGDTRHFAGVWIKKARVWSATGAENPDLKSFDDTVQGFMQSHNIPSGQLAVTRNSLLVYSRGYRWDYDDVDPVQPDSLFRTASLAKPLTSAGVMLLVQQGQLNLTDNLVNLITLPTPADTRTNAITVLNLLQHQGGWNRDTTFDPMFIDVDIAAALGLTLPISMQDIMTFMTGRSLDFAPGTDVNYSNYGYLLLGRIIEAVAQQTYGAYMQANVLAPLNMNRTILGASLMEQRQAGEVSYYVSDPNLYPNVRQAGAPANVMAPYGWFNLENMDAHGGWLSTALDLARFSTIFDATGGLPLLTQATIDQIFAVPATGVTANGSWYGLGWVARTAGAGLNTWHDGSLPGTYTLMVRRNDGLNWVIMFNQRDDKSDPTGATYGQIDDLLHNAANAVTTWPPGGPFPG